MPLVPLLIATALAVLALGVCAAVARRPDGNGRAPLVSAYLLALACAMPGMLALAAATLLSGMGRIGAGAGTDAVLTAIVLYTALCLAGGAGILLLRQMRRN